MFYNGANCDIYIGKGAGKKLLEDIRSAQHSIKIVSPYLSPYLIKELIDLRHQGIDVSLVTTDCIEEGSNTEEKNIHQLILQDRVTDFEAVNLRERWKELKRIFLIALLLCVGAVAATAYLFKDVKVAFGGLPIVVFFVFYQVFNSKVKGKRIYHYSYRRLFPFRVYLSKRYDDGPTIFVHSKIYIIDDRVAYMGSLNYTSSGTKYNYETRIRTEDAGAVASIRGEFDGLLTMPGLLHADIQRWGQSLYPEPIN